MSDIGIITPYAGQVRAIRRQYAKKDWTQLKLGLWMVIRVVRRRGDHLLMRTIKQRGEMLAS